MARKLKTFTTSAGFFDLAVAAPSMKAALEAWGSTSNLFHQGFARQSDDPNIVAATMAKPGVVLRRAVGTDTAFGEHAALPTNLGDGKARKAPVRPPARTAKPPKPSKPAKPLDEKAVRAAAVAYEREQRRREQEERKEEAARKKERERRERDIAAAEAALEVARKAHQARVDEIEKARAALDKKAQAEDALWDRKKQQLERALRQARMPKHLKLVPQE